MCDSFLGMGIENRYHYGTGSRTTDTYGTESNLIFRFHFSVLEKYTVFYRPLVVVKTKLKNAHTAHARTHTYLT